MATLHYFSLAIFLIAGIIIGYVGGVQGMKNTYKCIGATALVITQP